MANQADAFIALPGNRITLSLNRSPPFRAFTDSCSSRGHLGGYGTLEELLEVVTWAQLGIHDKPVRFWRSLGQYEMQMNESSVMRLKVNCLSCM